MTKQGKKNNEVRKRSFYLNVIDFDVSSTRREFSRLLESSVPHSSLFYNSFTLDYFHSASDNKKKLKNGKLGIVVCKCEKQKSWISERIGIGVLNPLVSLSLTYILTVSFHRQRNFGEVSMDDKHKILENCVNIALLRGARVLFKQQGENSGYSRMCKKKKYKNTRFRDE